MFLRCIVFLALVFSGNSTPVKDMDKECVTRGLEGTVCTIDCLEGNVCKTYQTVETCSCDGVYSKVNGSATYNTKTGRLKETDEGWKKYEEQMDCQSCSSRCKKYGPGHRKTLPVTDLRDCEGHVGNFTDPRDGNVYGTITLGNQTWMTENLRFWDQLDAFDYNNTDKYTQENGLLYTFYSAIKAAPKGWHLPSDDEWKVLETFLGMPAEDLDIQSYRQKRGTDEGAQLRVGGSSGMNFPMAGYGYDWQPGANGFMDMRYDGFGSDSDNYATCDGRCRAYIWGDNKTFPVTKSDGTTELQTFRRRLEARDVDGFDSKIIYRFSNRVPRPDQTEDKGYAISARYIRN